MGGLLSFPLIKRPATKTATLAPSKTRKRIRMDCENAYLRGGMKAARGGFAASSLSSAAGEARICPTRLGSLSAALLLGGMPASALES